MKLGRKGFTLIELIIVVIIVGILAAIAGPLMSGNVNKAKRAEAVAALGAIRTAERLYYAENAASYTGAISNFADTTNKLATYIGATDLDGKYFGVNAYSVTSANVAKCDVTVSKDSAVASSSPNSITLDMSGALTGG